MNYRIDCKQWGRFFSVPCSVVDDYILLSDGDFVKVLLCVLCSNSQSVSTEELAAKAGVSLEKAEDAILHWAGLGVITAQPEGGKPLTENKPVAVKSSNAKVQLVPAINPSKNSVDSKTRVKYSTREIAEKIENSEELKALYDNIQKVFGRTINGTEMAAVLNLYEYYNYSAASILMIAEYCTSIGKGRMAYIETVAKNWFEQGICSYSDVEGEIIRQTEIRSFENQVMRAFGIENKLSKKQKELVQKWRDMGFSLEMLEIAYEKCMNSTNKLNFGYINKILENWSGKNITTPRQVDEDDSKYAVSKNGNSKKDKNNKETSYDLDEWEQYAMNFDPSNRGGVKHNEI
ncbi:MAG: DnaD domain protein [Oscillospiraceae bacterium]